MRLALINLEQETEYPPPPLGLLSIATYLKEFMDFENTKIIDYSFDRPNKCKEEQRDIINGKPDLIGISSMTYSYRYAVNLASSIKRTLDVPIIIGGVQISAIPHLFPESFDIGVIGEGEETMLELVSIYERFTNFPSDELKKVDGIVFRDKKLITTEPRKPIMPLDKIPIPDRSFLNKDRYFKSHVQWNDEVGVGTTIMTSRGCPYRCVFCSTSSFWKRVRFHSAEYVIEEIKYLISDYGVEYIHIWDDLFTLNKKRVEEIVSLLKEEGISNRVKFNCQSRADLVDKNLCGLLKQMNVDTLSFGFESGSERVLKFLKNGSVTVDDNKDAIRLCRKYGFRIEGSLMFGSPGETVDDMEETLDFIEFMDKEGVDKTWCFVTTPYPGTKIWEIAKDRGKLESDMIFDNSLYDADNPLLLDDSVDKILFKKIFQEATEMSERFDKRKSSRRANLKIKLKTNPLGTFYFLLSEPRRAFRFLRRMI